MANTDQIIETIEYIEEHLKDKMSLDDLSRKFHISKFHMHRVFSSLAGMPLMRYIRERKLSSSIFDLLKTDMNIIDIAFEYGFSDEQTYIRAFKNTFGLSPTRVRRNKETVKITDKIDTNSITPIGKGMIFMPEMVIRPESFLIGVRSSVFDPVTKQHLRAKVQGPEFFTKYRESISNTLNNNIYIGYTELMPGLSDYDFYLEHILEYNKHRFLTVAAEVSDLQNIPEGMVGIKIPAMQFATFKYIGFHSPENLEAFTPISDIHEFIYCRWLKESIYQLSHEFLLEWMNLSLCREDYTEYQIGVPVKLKENRS